MLKNALLPYIFSVLILNTHGQSWQPLIPAIADGGETFSNLLLVSGSKAMAPYADTFINAVEGAVYHGKRYLTLIAQMVMTIDKSPELLTTSKKIEEEIQVLESALDDIERQGRLGGHIVKLTAECVNPQYDTIAKIKDQTFIELGEVVERQRDAIMDLLAAGSSIEQQITYLEDVQTKILKAAVDGNVTDALQMILSNRREMEKNINIIERVFTGAIEDYQLVSGRAAQQLEEVLQLIQVDGRKILRTVNHCLAPKLKEHLNSNNLSGTIP